MKSLSPSLSKSPQDTEAFERPINGSSFLVNVIELFSRVKVVASELLKFPLIIDGVNIIVSSSSST